MGADLIVAVLEIPKGNIPDWIAAENKIKAMTDDECVAVVRDVLGTDEFSSDGDYDAGGVRERIISALDYVQSGWEGRLRLMVKLDGVFTTMLIAGDSSWGDDVDTVNDLALFYSACGNEAGFL